jgi:hypothetical protein
MEVEINTSVEIDEHTLWEAVEDNVGEVAYEAARNALDETDFSDYVNYADGAMDLLRDYSPGNSCSLGELFTDSVQSAVVHGDFLAEALKQATGTTDGVPAVDPEDLRKLVRAEIRYALVEARKAIDRGVVGVGGEDHIVVV